MGAKLLEHIAGEGICVHDVSAPDEHTLKIRVSRKDEKAFLKLLSRFHLTYTTDAVCGCAKIRKTLRSHSVLAVGLVSGILLVYFLSLRIWVIDGKNAPDGFHDSLNRFSVSPGVSKSRVDVNALSRQLEAVYPEYAHIGVRISGVVLRINCVKAEQAPGVFDITDHRNLIAERDGVIENIDVFAGQAQVKRGDTVLKGDVLILGEERADKDGAVTPVRARGKVTARVWTKGDSAVRTQYIRNVRTGSASAVTEIQTPFFVRKLAGENPFQEYETVRHESKLVGLFLPVRLVTNEYYEIKAEKTSIEADAARQLAYENALSEALQKAPRGAKEARRWAEYRNQDQDTIACSAVVEWIMDIATDEQGG